MGKPWPLVKVELIDGLCQRWSCPPSQILREPTDLVFQMVSILALAKPKEEAPDMETNLGNLSRPLSG